MDGRMCGKSDQRTNIQVQLSYGLSNSEEGISFPVSTLLQNEPNNKDFRKTRRCSGIFLCWYLCTINRSLSRKSGYWKGTKRTTERTRLSYFIFSIYSSNLAIMLIAPLSRKTLNSIISSCRSSASSLSAPSIY